MSNLRRLLMVEALSNTSSGITQVIYEDGTIANYNLYSIGDINKESNDSQIRNLKEVSSIIIGNNVSTIYNNALQGCTKLISLTIPSSVTAVGYNALSGCFIEESNIVNNSEIDLETSGLTICDIRTEDGICIKDNTVITYLGECENISIPNSVTSIGARAFCGCTELKNIELVDSIKSIDHDAFRGCVNLTNITLPSCLEKIGPYAFRECGLTSIMIPSNVNSLYANSFINCELSSISVDSNNSKYSSGNNCNAIIDSTTNELVIGCKNTIIPNTVVGIGIESFCSCKTITSIYIPDSVEYIGNFAFSGCSSLTNCVIPNGVTSIGAYSFYGCDKLDVNIPTSLTSIGAYAFGSSGITQAMIPSNITTIYDGTFSGCIHIVSINIPASVTKIGADKNNAFEGCYVESANIINNTSITSTTTNEAGETVSLTTSIDLTEQGLTICDTRTDDGICIKDNEMIAYWGSGSSVTIPTGVVKICEGTMSAKDNINSIVVPSSVTTIENYAFASSRNITSITLPDSITSVGVMLFFECESLEEINYAGTDGEFTEIYRYTGYDSIANLVVHCADGDIPHVFTSISSMRTSLFNNEYTDVSMALEFEPDLIVNGITYTDNSINGISDTMVDGTRCLCVDIDSLPASVTYIDLIDERLNLNRKIVVTVGTKIKDVVIAFMHHTNLNVEVKDVVDVASVNEAPEFTDQSRVVYMFIHGGEIMFGEYEPILNDD